MMTVLMWILGYIGIGLAMWLWDSFIGFESDETDETPAPVMVFVLWPIFLPIILGIVLHDKLAQVRASRIRKNKQKQKLRIAQQEEFDKIWKEVEEEAKGTLHHEGKS